MDGQSAHGISELVVFSRHLPVGLRRLATVAPARVGPAGLGPSRLVPGDARRIPGLQAVAGRGWQARAVRGSRCQRRWRSHGGRGEHGSADGLGGPGGERVRLGVRGDEQGTEGTTCSRRRLGSGCQVRQVSTAPGARARSSARFWDCVELWGFFPSGWSHPCVFPLSSLDLHPGVNLSNALVSLAQDQGWE